MSHPLTLHIILGITQVTGRKNVVISSSLLDLESVATKVKMGHVVHHVLRQIQHGKLLVGFTGCTLVNLQPEYLADQSL
eukprot:313247-Pelagomonas_calceolata.AAC.1